MRTSLFATVLIIIVSSLPFSIIHAQSEGDININATVPGCSIQVLIKPEKRIPAEGNFQNKNLIIIFDQLNQELFRFENVETDKDGYASLDTCDSPVSTQPGIFSIYVKGYSHLGKFYTAKQGFFQYQTFFNLAETSDDFLLAGDVTDHDYINSLDLDTVKSKLYTNDTKYDLNQDGIVNSLDLGNLIYNLHKGSQLPYEQ